MRGFPRSWVDAGPMAGVCREPISASTLTAYVAVAATVASTALAAASAVQQGRTAQAGANYNAAISRNNAIATEQAGAAEADRQNLQRRRLMASGVAAAGASGVDPMSGSPLEVMADLAGQAKLEEEMNRWQVRNRAQGFSQQSVLDTFQGRQARTAGYWNATTTVLQGTTRVASMIPSSP